MVTVSRRSALLLPVLVAAGVPVVAGCTERPGEHVDVQPSSSSTGAPDGEVLVESHFLGNRLTVEVSPVVRVSEGITAVLLTFTRAEDDASMEEVRWSWTDGGDRLDVTNSLVNVSYPTGALVDLAGGRVWATTQDRLDVEVELGPGESGGVIEFFGPVDVDEVRVFVPMTGFVPVKVMDREAASQAGVDLGALDSALEELRADSSRGAPVAIERYARSLDESSSTLTTGNEVTMTLSSDVTFESDSAELSGAADAQLQVVADQVAQYPDGGDLVIVGHTDDVQDEAYNQDLSDRRAQAVRQRLEGLADLGGWKVSTSGKGETEPLVSDTTDEARAANRRVEITLTPTGGTGGQGGSAGGGASATPSSGSPSSSGALPEARGVVGRGPEGVTVPGPYGNGQITVVLAQVTRVGDYLLGEVEVTTGKGAGGSGYNIGDWLTDPGQEYMTNVRGEEGLGASKGGTATGLTLLAGGERYFPADYLAAGKDAHTPLTERSLDTYLNGGYATRVCVVWPDTGQDSVVLDHEGDSDDAGYAFRLTDIPVVEEG